MPEEPFPNKDMHKRAGLLIVMYLGYLGESLCVPAGLRGE